MQESLQITKQTSSLGEIIIKPVNKEIAKEMIIKNHYSHKWNTPFGKYNFGIFRANDPNKCLGVASYGYMKNPKANIFSHPNPQAWMCELNRMWIDDELGHNAETILIGNSIKLLKKIDPNCVAVQSFADGRLGCGTIYKASNFKYYGYHYTTFLVHKKTQEITQQQAFTDSTTYKRYLHRNLGLLLGEYKPFKVKTYRYVYPLSPKFKILLQEKPYPQYEKGTIAYTWDFDKEQIKQRMIEKILAL